MIDPSTVTTEAARRAQSSLPTKTRSEATISHQPPEPSTPAPGDSDSEDDSDDEDESGENLSMSPIDIRVIRRLAARANVLPVIAKADSLTDGKLAAIKKVVRRDLHAANLDFGVFGPVLAGEERPKSSASPTNGSTNGHRDSNGSGTAGGHSDEENEEMTLPTCLSVSSLDPVSRVGRVFSMSSLGDGKPGQLEESHSLLVGT
ncbi:hypothetical protein NUW54_g10205 [Trametes sanguinea]|uniref:Uncharacterized protein n=1 Tax=Trametes sanguinea TaxID=158606 RepID=A0ACC1P203_9APHY|nr:hypothetical protein NUW54_g10205 [Trametes sanguinea]